MASKKILFRSNGVVAVLTMKELNQIVREKGLDTAGDVQSFHTQNVLRRIKKYMPFVSGLLYKLTVAQTNIRKPFIITDAPQAQYLFRGKVMIDPAIGAAGFLTPEGWRSRRGCTKVLTGRNLKYNRNKNPKAGARWDIALKAAESAAMRADVQRYIDRKG